MLFVLEVTPEEVAQRTKRVDLQKSKRILLTRGASVLETPGDRLHRLDEHALLVPVGPDELNEAWVTELFADDTLAQSHQVGVGVGAVNQRNAAEILTYELQVWKCRVVGIAVP